MHQTQLWLNASQIDYILYSLHGKVNVEIKYIDAFFYIPCR